MIFWDEKMMKEAAESAGRSAGDADESRDRYRRPDATRQEPIRSWWNFFRPAESPNGSSQKPPGDGRKLNHVVDRGVKLGYQVIEDQIRQGQRLAEEINSRSYGTESMNRDLQELAIRSMRYYVDAASLFMDFMSTLPASVGLPFRPFGGAANGAAGPSNGPPPYGSAAPGGAPPSYAPPPAAAAPTPVATRVTSTRPATVTVDLRADDARRPLSVPGLFTAEKGTPPLSDVACLSASGDGRPVLAVEVPDDQPPGLYSGVIFDAESGEPRGSVTVRIDP